MDYTYNLETIKDFFKADKFAAVSGIAINSVSDSNVVCSMVISETHKNAAGGVQGGAIFTLCDFTFAVHSNLSLFRADAVPSVTVAQSSSISYLKNTRGSILYGSSKRLHEGRSTNVYRVSVTDDLGVLIAEAMFNGFSSERVPDSLNYTKNSAG